MGKLLLRDKHIIKLEDRIKGDRDAMNVFLISDRPDLENVIMLQDWIGIAGVHEENILLLTMSELNAGIYSYNPKALSRIVYGTPDLHFLILFLNNITHPGELDLTKTRKIKILNDAGVRNMMKAIEVRGLARFDEKVKQEKADLIRKRNI